MRAAMELVVTGDSLSGVEAARLGSANRSFPPEQLEGAVLEIAGRVAKLPPDIVQLNKRNVHRSMELKGFRTAIRQGTELCTLGTHQQSFHEFMKQMASGSLTQALQERDEPFGDYRTRKKR